MAVCGHCVINLAKQLDCKGFKSKFWHIHHKDAFTLIMVVEKQKIENWDHPNILAAAVRVTLQQPVLTSRQ